MEMENNVKVAVRIRPQLPKEVIEMCSICTNVHPSEPQVWLGKDKAFTFDRIFDISSEQHQIYDSTVFQLIEGCLEGYNATVLAYGQTGSGKTYTMGTGFDIEGKTSEKGIIPRAVDHLFNSIKVRQEKARMESLPVPEFKVNAQFLELYNEDIIDLLADERTKHSQIKIHEDAQGGIYTMGATTRPVNSIESTLNCLKKGALSRTTASTQMNSSSSRSHAIFTVHIKQQRVVTVENLLEEESDDAIENGDANHVSCEGTGLNQEFETLTAKFHFVDLAGSERLKRTGATGERQKEGISINSGLLALGNVISALGDRSKRASHIPYRDSKLTRVLQDSLGGNSRTMMIACISPSDRDFMETLNTLRYANRAKNIKNRVVANQDKSSQTIMLLRREIQQLQLELMEYKQGKRLIAEDGTETINDMYYENNMLQSEINSLKTRIKALQETNERLVARNSELLLEKEEGNWIKSEGGKSDIREIIQGYVREIEGLRTKLIEMEETCSTLRKQMQRNQTQRLSLGNYSGTGVALTGHYDVGFEETESNTVIDVLDEAKKDIAKQKKIVSKNVKEETHDDNGNEVQEATMVNGGDDIENGTQTSEDESEEDKEDEKNKNEIELVELTNEISVKEKLITELEKSQKKMNTMKQHYEDKLMQLQVKIHEIESERDQVLAKLNQGSQNNDHAKKIKEDYHKKLTSLQSEMKKMQIAKREHVQAMRNQTQYENQLRNLRNDVNDMKKQKVKLLNRMKEEAQKYREAELKNTKKIAQLTKQERVKDFKIKSLEVEKNKVKAMLKRKDDEMLALKRRMKPMSDLAAGRLPGRANVLRAVKKLPHPFSPKIAKQTWTRLEKNIDKLILNKQGISIHEKQMNRFMHQREQLSHALEKLIKKLEGAIKLGKDEREIRDEMESCEANIEYINQNINECQSTIVQLEDAREEAELENLNEFLNTGNRDDIKYIFEKVLTMAINQSLLASQREEEKREFELKYKQSIDSSLIQEQLLHHVLENSFVESDLVPDDIPTPDSDNFLVPARPIESQLPPLPPVQQDQSSRSEKARRLTKTPQELLYEISSDSKKDNQMTKSLVNPTAILNCGGELQRVPSAPSLNKENLNKPIKPETYSPALKRKPLDNRKTNKNVPIINQTQSYISRHMPSSEISETTPPSSPPISRRNRTDNVFSRLTIGTAVNSQINPDRGIINPFSSKVIFEKQSPLICTHVAEGHSRAVLSIASTNDVMFTGSKDCTAKIWDITTGQEIQSLTDLPDAVVRVRYNEYSRLAFTVSKSYINIWDPRENPARCIKTLNSSGLVCTNVNRGPELAPGENRINDIRLNPYGTSLFSTCGSIVRVWDLRMFYCIGKLNTSHQAQVVCLAVDEAGVDNNLVITGSKDHFIKVFEVMEGVGGIHNPKITLEPPHCDGIESLAVNGDCLFSASRDKFIKKWDLSLPKEKLVHSMLAHKDWIYSLSLHTPHNTLISGCRSGYIKLWSADTCQPIGDSIRAHMNAIHSIDTNASLVFTASADTTVGLWKWKYSEVFPEHGD